MAAAEIRRDKVILFGDCNYKWDIESETYVRTEPENKNAYKVEILDVKDIIKNRIITDKYVLPLEDATIRQGEDGTYYCYNAALPYINEVAHLAEVEKNIIVEQAFLYPNRSMMSQQKSNTMNYLVIGALTIIAIIGMIT